MATAMLAGLSQQQLIEPKHITVSDPNPAQLAKVAGHYPLQTTADNRSAVQGQHIIILAVKPQLLGEVCTDLKGHLPPDALLISIIAGVPMATIRQQLNHQSLVRVMPNTPAQVGRGMSVWCCTPEVSEMQQHQTQTILAACGEELMVAQEGYLDMATALSGSGPAYVFLLLEAMIDAGVHLGFPRPMAEQLVYQTVEGSVAFARNSGRHPAELRNMVTSPGGTTAAALFELEQGGLRTTMAKAIWAAYHKSRALGGGGNHD